MNERRLLSEVPYLGDVKVLPRSRDLFGRFLPGGAARITGRATALNWVTGEATPDWTLSYLELTYSGRRAGSGSPVRKVSPGLMVCDLGPQARTPLKYPDAYNGNP